MSAMVDRLTKAMIEADGATDGLPDYPELARLAFETMRHPCPHVMARVADRLGVPPSDVARLVGTWTIMVDEVMK